MSEFLKCECWYCGQSIKFPAGGIGISVLCPTCKKPLTLKHKGSTTQFGSIVFPPTSTRSRGVATTDTITLKIDAEDILLHKVGKLEAKLKETSYVARARREPATDKQKAKLLWFGCTFDETITKGQANDALNECVIDFPLKEQAYYQRPATEVQIAQLREYAKADKDLVVMIEKLEEADSSLTYGEAKDLLRDCERKAERRKMDGFSIPPNKAQRKKLKALNIKLDTKLKHKITAEEADEILNLKGAPPRDEDLSLFKQHGITSFQGDSLGAFALGDLIRYFGGSAQPHNREDKNYVTAYFAAVKDPDYHTPKLTRDEEGFVALAWPKHKIRKWLRAAKAD